MICAHGLTYTYYFSRHSYSAIGASWGRMQHESLPRPVTTAPAAIKPVHWRGRHGSSRPRLGSVLVSPPSGTVHRCSPRSCLRSSRTVADAGEHGPALLESVLMGGATPGRTEKFADARLMCLGVAQLLWALTRSVTCQGSELDGRDPDRSGHLRTRLTQAPRSGLR